MDNESGAIGCDSSKEGTQVSEKELEDEEQGEATSVPRDTTLTPLMWMWIILSQTFIILIIADQA